MQQIPWAWLKATPPGTWGVIPQCGLSFYHTPGDALRAEAIVVDGGDTCLAIQPRGSRWTRPAALGFDAHERALLRSRCPDRLASRQ